jgi:hypothetical protein
MVVTSAELRFLKGHPMRILLSVACLGLLAACQPNVPDSGAGVGFENYTDYEARRAQREEALNTNTRMPIATEQSTPATAAPQTLGQEAMAVLGTQTPTTSQQTPDAVAPVAPSNNAGLSDEQSFTGRETIESDRERLAQNRAQYQEIAPTAVPTRSGSAGSNIVEYALSSTNRVGQTVYKRFGLLTEGRYNRACAKFAAPDLAQIAFLDAGGPKKDRLGVDPDGDGFACTWDPQPFRNAKK